MFNMTMFNTRYFLSLTLLTGTLSACGPHLISGQVIDRNGEPVARAIVGLQPGNVEIVTDGQGQFLVDYLRDEKGERVKLKKRTDYDVEIFKPGFHVLGQAFYYKRGELFMEPMVLKEDSIRVIGNDEIYDPSDHRDRTHSAGQSLEGE
jgi:hypothetical protein